MHKNYEEQIKDAWMKLASLIYDEYMRPNNEVKDLIRHVEHSRIVKEGIRRKREKGEAEESSKI